MTAQGVIRGKRDEFGERYKPKTTRFYASWQPNEQFILRTGRISVPIRPGTAYRDVGMAYPWPMSQVDTYGIEDTVHGLDLRWRHSLGNWILQIQPYWGNRKRFAIDSIGGLAVQLSLFDDFNIVLNRMQTKNRADLRTPMRTIATNFLSTTIYQQTYNTLTGMGMPADIAAAQAQQSVEANAALILDSANTLVAEPYFDDTIRQRNWSLGFSYEKHDWLIIGEYMNIRNLNFGTKTPDWNLTVGHYFGNFMPYIEYARAKSSPPTRLLVPTNPLNLPFAAQLNAMSASAPPGGCKIYALGANYAFARGWDIKAEVRRTVPKDGTFFALKRDGVSSYTRPVNQYTITVNHVF